MVADAAELYAAYRSRKVHGRILVHLGRYLHFVEIGDNDTYRGFFQFPIPAFSALRSYEEHISYRNVLWVGMQANLFREIISIVPPQVFQEKAGSIGPQDSNVVAGQYFFSGNLTCQAPRLQKQLYAITG